MKPEDLMVFDKDIEKKIEPIFLKGIKSWAMPKVFPSN